MSTFSTYPSSGVIRFVHQTTILIVVTQEYVKSCRQYTGTEINRHHVRVSEVGASSVSLSCLIACMVSSSKPTILTIWKSCDTSSSRTATGIQLLSLLLCNAVAVKTWSVLTYNANLCNPKYLRAPRRSSERQKQKTVGLVSKPGIRGVVAGRNSISVSTHKHCTGHEHIFSQRDGPQTRLVIAGAT